MREYKMRRGEHLSDRVEDMEAFIEDHFGEVTGETDYNDGTLLVVDDPDNPVFDRVVGGTVEYSSKKDRVALNIEERPAEEVIAEGHVDAAEDAVTVKNASRGGHRPRRKGPPGLDETRRRGRRRETRQRLSRHGHPGRRSGAVDSRGRRSCLTVSPPVRGPRSSSCPHGGHP
jgi:hypothetical protein